MTGLEDAFDRIGSAAEDLLPRTHAPGLALAVTDGDATLGAVVRGFADVGAGRPVRAETRFQIGSISKSFAALCVLQEEAKGRLALDVSVNELLPWLELPEPFGPITLHHLLTHTSGLTEGVQHAPWGIVDALRARAYPPTIPPGERYFYSNLGYKLVGHALERVTDSPVNELLHERILGPLGMTRSVGATLEEDRADAAVGYEPLLSDRPAHLQSRLAPALWQVSNTADGSIVSTVGDLCAYGRMVLARGGDLLDGTAFDRWIGPYVDAEDAGARYGYGWNVFDGAGGRVIRHTGGTLGFNAYLAIHPGEGLAVAICLNGSGDRKSLGTFAAVAVAAALRGDGVPDAAREEPRDRIADADAIAGRFVAGDRSLELEPVDDGLMLRSGPVAVRLERWPDEPDTFAVPHPGFDRFLLRVERADGRPSALTHGPDRYEREGATAFAGLGHDPAWDAYPGLYRADGPWNAALRVYLRGGRLWCTWPSDGEELELTPVGDGWFAVGDPVLPRRCRFADEVGGLAQSIEYDGAVLSRSFDG